MKRKGASKRLGTIDLDTGEIFEDGVPVWVGAKIRWHEDFTMTFQDAVQEIARDKDMTHQMLRVWMMMVGKMSFENWVTVPQKEFSDALNMPKQNVSRAIKGLIEKGLILKGPKMGRTTAYKLNSYYAWKGKIKHLERDRMSQVKDFFSEVEKRKNAP